MKEIIDYKILSSKSVNELEKEVKTYLSYGWKLQGAVFVSETEYSTEYYQTIIFEKVEY